MTNSSSSTPSFFSKFRSFLFPRKPKKGTPLHVPTLSTTSRAAPDKLMVSNSNDFERLFRYFDEDGDGKISPAELRNCMKKSTGEDLSAEDAEAVVGSTDSDGDGLLEFDDFVKLVESEGEEEKAKSLREAFQLYEMKGHDCITPNSLRVAFGRLGEPKSLEECKAMIRNLDLDGDGVISFDEFRVMML